MGKWEMVRLEECITLTSGKFLSKKQRIDGEYDVYGGNGITGKHNEYFINDPTVIIGRVGEYCGCVHTTGEKVWITDNALYVTNFLRDIHKGYICYALNNKNLNHYANKSGQPSISQSAILKLQISLPPLEIQNKIAQTLDTASELIVLRKKQLVELDNLIKSTFYDMFGDSVVNERGWEVKKLESITSKIGSGATPKGGKESYHKVGVSLIRSMNVYNGLFKYEQLAHLDNEQASKLDNVTVEEDDVLINITGASVARSCIVPIDVLPARVNQHVSIVRTINNIVNCKYINNVFISVSFQQKLLAVGGAGGATREAITKNQLQELQIPLPPLSLQNQFAQIVTKIEEQKSLVQKALDESQYLFDSLMSEYFE